MSAVGEVKSARKILSLCLISMFAVFALLSLTACGEDATVSPSSTTTPSTTGSASALVVSNGSDKLAPAERLAAARDALKAESSFLISGQTIDGGPIRVAVVPGVGSQGQVSADGKKTRVTFRAVDGKVYVRGDESFLAKYVSKGAARTIGDKWVRLPADSGNAFGLFANPDSLVDSMLEFGPDLEDVPPVMIGNTVATGVVDTATGSLVWISGEGEPLPLRIEEPGATATVGTLTFSRFGKEIAIEAPSKANTIVATVPAQ